MKHVWLASTIIVACTSAGWGIYGPSLARADASVAMRACQEGKFRQGPQITKAIQSGNTADVLLIVRDTLDEWRGTSETSVVYAARAFCVHELIPSSLPPENPEAPVSSSQPTKDVRQFHNLGIDYFYYSPDGAWTLRENPVDLDQLATRHPESQWGRQAFLMMTLIGWSQGGCQEGPDQFRVVIAHSKKFLAEYPNSEVSDAIRLELAKSYATWWNLSRAKADEYTKPETYRAGSQEAKQEAIRLFREYLRAQESPAEDVERRLKALLENPKGSDDYDYWCADYED